MSRSDRLSSDAHTPADANVPIHRRGESRGAALPGLRFHSPADNRRPYGAHRFEVWSPTLRRALTLFGEHGLEAWVAIEAEPAIDAFCERPVVDRYSKPPRVIDFWVRRGRAEELWLLRREKEESQDELTVVHPAFSQWAESHGLTLRTCAREEVCLAPIASQNWRIALQYLAANRDLLTEAFTARVRESCRECIDIQTLQGVLAQEDPVLVRAAVFALLRRGELQSANFASAAFGPATRLQPV